MLRCWAWFGCRSWVVRLDCRGELDEGRLAMSMGETVLGMATMGGSRGDAALNRGCTSSSSSSSGKSKSSEVNSSARVLV